MKTASVARYSIFLKGENGCWVGVEGKMAGRSAASEYTLIKATLSVIKWVFLSTFQFEIAFAFLSLKNYGFN